MDVKRPCGAVVRCDVSDLPHRHSLWEVCGAGEVAALTTDIIGHKKPGMIGCISGAWCPFLLACPCPQGFPADFGSRTGQESQ